MARPSRALIDLGALRHNYHLAKQCAPASQNLVVVKANAYGHGALAVAQALEPLAPAMGVACIEEALALRGGGIKCPILLLEGPFSADELVLAAEQKLWVVLENATQVQWLLEARLSRPLQVWLKLDTGMHRLGLPSQQAGSCYAQVAASANVSDVVMATHFSCADDLASPAT
ncbi:MAG: alanine racemase, partial [Halieaceae bacterium]